ncbi:MAG: 16S rRNA (uracil(1498)-N(3))-methyltransferase [Deltaproteobacteria bacterium]|nr:16S rRNA (uracil(1498)-N(3))-methyltransferase [Deltaproteobacteria bacterium]
MGLYPFPGKALKASFAMRRFHIPSEQLHGPQPFLGGDEARHLLQVLRMKVGDQVILFDNSNQEYQVRIQSISGNQVYFEIEDHQTIIRESALKITIGIPLIRPQPFEWILQKGTELGVSAFRPYYSTHSRRNFEKSEMDSRMKRWQRILIEAAKQCERNVLPEFLPPVPFSDLLKGYPEALKIIPYEEESSRTLEELKPPLQTPVLALVGPEGGFHKDEIKQAEGKGFIPISLGPRILRSETAALALICLLQFVWGDMGLRPSGPADPGTGRR